MAQAGEVEGNFAKGNRLYAAGQFSEAAAVYENSARADGPSANLFYNLANAYYRAGDRGHAILNYQRALVLDPGHTEASANLAFVRGGHAGESARAPGAFASLWETLAGPGVDFYCWLAAGVGWLAALGLMLAIFRRQSRRAGIALAVVGAVGCVLCAGIAYWLDGGQKSPRRALVIADAGAPALYSPADNAKTIVRVPVGGEVRVLSAQGAWMYVQLGDGARGWMSADKAARINPTRP